MTWFEICAAGPGEAPLPACDTVRRDDESWRAGLHPGRHQDEERPGLLAALSGVQHLPQPAAVGAAGQLRPLSVHAAVRPAGEAWAERRVRAQHSLLLLNAAQSSSHCCLELPSMPFSSVVLWMCSQSCWKYSLSQIITFIQVYPVE